MRLRRHTCRIEATEHDQWLLCVHLVLDEQVGDTELRSDPRQAFDSMADHRVNTDDLAAVS